MFKLFPLLFSNFLKQPIRLIYTITFSLMVLALGYVSFKYFLLSKSHSAALLKISKLQTQNTLLKTQLKEQEKLLKECSNKFQNLLLEINKVEIEELKRDLNDAKERFLNGNNSPSHILRAP